MATAESRDGDTDAISGVTAAEISESVRDLVERMRGALLAEDPEASILPYCLSGGTDNKALSTMGIVGYGFAPLRLPADLDFAPMFHGIDERVPLESLEFGAKVLWRLVGDC